MKVQLVLVLGVPILAMAISGAVYAAAASSGSTTTGDTKTGQTPIAASPPPSPQSGGSITADAAAFARSPLQSLAAKNVADARAKAIFLANDPNGRGTHVAGPTERTKYDFDGAPDTVESDAIVSPLARAHE